ncbi:MAG: hypothetical protein ACK5Z5_07555 [Neisseriaceae bacterium]|jgi:hypothetical protein
MAGFYAERGFITFNGVPFTDQGNIKSITVNINENLSEVAGMTADHSTPGFTRGNTTINASVEIFIPNQGNTVPNFSALDYESNNFALVVVASSGAYNGKYAGKTYILNNIAYDGGSTGFAGVGQVGTTTVSFKAQTYQEVN